MNVIDNFLVYPPGAAGMFLSSLLYPSNFAKFANSNEYYPKHDSNNLKIYWSSVYTNYIIESCSNNVIDLDVLDSQDFSITEDYDFGTGHFLPLPFSEQNIKINNIIMIDFYDRFVPFELVRLKKNFDNIITPRNIKTISDILNNSPDIYDHLEKFHNGKTIRINSGYLKNHRIINDDYFFYNYFMERNESPTESLYKDFLIENYIKSSDNNIVYPNYTLFSDHCKLIHEKFSDSNITHIMYEDFFFKGKSEKIFKNCSLKIKEYSEQNLDILFQYYSSVFEYNQIGKEIRDKLCSFKEDLAKSFN